LHYDRLASCRACPRLVRHLDQVRKRYPDYHCAPVPAWGSASARLLIVGLAPGRHGANRTGRPFTGDASGYFLFEGLRRVGLVTEADPAGSRLCGIRITNAVRCLPPGNRPCAAELRRCSFYLRHELDQLWRPKVRRPRCVLVLGRLAHQGVALALDRRLPSFAHGATDELAPHLWLTSHYHPSRQNTNTGRLTPAMRDEVLDRVVALLDS
jgi:uracil-DNA glycosylase family 4